MNTPKNYFGQFLFSYFLIWEIENLNIIGGLSYYRDSGEPQKAFAHFAAVY